MSGKMIFVFIPPALLCNIKVLYASYASLDKGHATRPKQKVRFKNRGGQLLTKFLQNLSVSR